MELPNKLLEQIAFNTRPKKEGHILVVMDKSTHEERLSQPLQTNNKHFKIAVTFLSGYNCNFNVANKNNKFYFTKSFSDEDGFMQITIPPGDFEIESLKDETKRNIIDEELYTESIYPFTIKRHFSTLGSIIEIFTHGPIITIVPVDSTRDLSGFNKNTKY